MKYFNPLKTLSRFEWGLWIFSLFCVILSALLSPEFDGIALADSVLGVSCLIFLAKGDPLGQVLTILFAGVYNIMAFKCHYYGELIINCGLMIPLALFSLWSWLRNPYSQDSSEVKVSQVGLKHVIFLVLLLIVISFGGYYLLKAFNTENLIIGVISLLTSFTASYLMFFRSRFYAISYMCNDVVLIILWSLASVSNKGYITMVVNFSIFLVNDLYGFINWGRLKKRQEEKR